MYDVHREVGSTRGGIAKRTLLPSAGIMRDWFEDLGNTPPLGDFNAERISFFPSLNAFP